MIEKLSVTTLDNKSNTIITGTPISTNTNAYLDIDGLAQVRDWVLKKIQEAKTEIPMTMRKCQNCGGALEMKMDKYIWVCPYCKMVHTIGTAHINDKG